MDFLALARMIRRADPRSTGFGLNLDIFAYREVARSSGGAGFNDVSNHHLGRVVCDAFVQALLWEGI
jgi:hypothetical protein